ncbi:MAG: divalent-cation tolerance protein CutA [Candidatus Omnitrophica bacterium]|nr:divalent-cation tolerance protein CutA [Candidatus Omnitrophota bacterium]MCM8826766.1 divalent-cation tolerance protein CutA [Candidatus Omnitrophota bacterium]
MSLVVLVTIPRKKAKFLAKKLLEKRLCACVNITNVESFFWWKDKIEEEKESLLIIKTKENIYPRLEKTIKTNHPYTVPEIIAIKIDKINKSYLQWLIGEVDANRNHSKYR